MGRFFLFLKEISETQQYKQLGNSVSIPVVGNCILHTSNIRGFQNEFNKGEWSELYTFLYFTRKSRFSYSR